MFAILLSEKMDPFYQNVASFPTLIFSILLIFMLLYWVLAALGLVELDMLDFDLGVDGISAGDSVDGGLNNLNVLSGLLLKFGLASVPLTVTITLVSLIGWVLSFTLVHYLFPIVPGRPLELLFGLGILFLCFVASLWATRIVLTPFIPLFEAASRHHKKTLIGKRAIVRTSRVDDRFGEAHLADGGAGLIIKVRSFGSERFSLGDTVVLIEKIDDGTIYRVVSERDFAG